MDEADDDFDEEDEGIVVGVKGGPYVENGDIVGRTEADDVGLLHADTSIDNLGCCPIIILSLPIDDIFVELDEFSFPMKLSPMLSRK